MTKWDEYLLHLTDNLRKLITENPELPLIIFCGEEANNGAYYWMGCGSIRAEIGEVLYNRGPLDAALDEEIIYCDRETVEERIADYLYDRDRAKAETMTDEEWDNYVEQEIHKYDPLWQKCIILYVDN